MVDRNEALRWYDELKEEAKAEVQTLDARLQQLSDLIGTVLAEDSASVSQDVSDKLRAARTAMANAEASVHFARTHGQARLPSKAYEADAGWDLYPLDDVELAQGVPQVIDTGVRLGRDWPADCVGLICGRSSLASEGVDVLGGVCDPGFRGRIRVCVVYHGSEETFWILANEPIAQVVPLQLHAGVHHGGSGMRGDRGFGSSRGAGR